LSLAVPILFEYGVTRGLTKKLIYMHDLLADHRTIEPSSYLLV